MGSDQPAGTRWQDQIEIGFIGVCRFAGVCGMQPGTRGFEESGGHWRLIETSAVRLPPIGMEIGDRSSSRPEVRRPSLQCSVRSMIVEETAVIEQLVFEIRRAPEEGAIQEFTSDRADKSFHKGMG